MIESETGAIPQVVVPGQGAGTDTLPAHASPGAQAGQRRIGRYILGPLLGIGGMGEVFEARDTLLNRTVALKLLRQRGPTALMRFLGEAQIQARVEHPNICRVFDVDTGGDTICIAMQLVRGGPLGEACRVMSQEEVLGTMILVAQAVHAAHRLKLVHRDLKPGNILMERSPEGRWTPYVCDFGLAMDMDSAGLTHTQGPLGTPAYMAPEQLRGERSRIGPHTDVYALGVTLSQALSGNPCILQKTAECGEGRKREHTPSQNLPRELRTILATCLEPEPRDRYASAAALAEDLRRFLDGEPILARATPPWTRLLRRIRKNPKVASALAAAILLLLGMAAWNVRTTLRGQQQTHLAQQLVGEMKDIEHLMRLERMMPAHDLRPALGRTRMRMDALRKTMQELGSQAEGPGHYALGRGHQMLGEPGQALGQLQKAWDQGFRTPDETYALGRAHCEVFAAESMRLEAQGTQGLEDLKRRHLLSAQRLFSQARGQTLEPMALGESVLARLQGQPDRALDLARQAFRERPWCYEAKALESSALTRKGFDLQTSGKPQAALDLYRQAREAAQCAQDLARSDEQALQVDLSQRMAWMAFELEHGFFAEKLFQEAEQICDRLLALDPGQVLPHRDKLRICQRRASYRLKHGQDPAEPLRKGLEHLEQARVQCGGTETFQEERLDLLWIKADHELLRGRDPRPTIRQALEPSFREEEPVEILQVQARWELEHGRDPRPTLDQAIRATRSGMVRKEMFYHHYFLGSSLRLKAHWEALRGLDPRPNAEAALRELRKALEMNPQSMWSWVESARAFQILAERTSRDPRGSVEAMGRAREDAERAVQLCPKAHETWWALAAVCLMEAQRALAQQRNPEDYLARGEKAIAAALEINPTRAQLHLVRGDLALARSRWQQSTGQPCQETLRMARRAFERGLSSNPTLLELRQGRRQCEAGAAGRTLPQNL